MILVYTVIRIELSEEKGQKNKTQNKKKNTFKFTVPC